jgi:predicted lysophospholipase L1 biosynthesis ABC-type transport system permease subunit
MEQYKDHLQDISAIRELMDRNSKFISLSGLSGVSAGLIALAGSAAIFYIDHSMLTTTMA